MKTKYAMHLSFTNAEEWAAVHEAIRRVKKLPPFDGVKDDSEPQFHAAIIAAICMDYLDDPGPGYPVMAAPPWTPPATKNPSTPLGAGGEAKT